MYIKLACIAFSFMLICLAILALIELRKALFFMNSIHEQNINRSLRRISAARERMEREKINDIINEMELYKL